MSKTQEILDKINLVTPYDATKALIAEVRNELLVSNHAGDLKDAVAGVDIHDDLLAGRRDEDTAEVSAVIDKLGDDLADLNEFLHDARDKCAHIITACTWLNVKRLDPALSKPINYNPHSIDGETTSTE